MQGVTNALFNTIFVSIPEEAFIVIMTLIFLGDFYDLLDIRMWKHGLKWIMVATLPVSIMINVFRYIIIIPKSLMSLISMVTMIILMIYVIVKNSHDINKKMILKTIMYTILSFIIVGIIEEAYYPILLSLLHKQISFFNNIVFYNLLLAIPTRILQLCVVLFILIRKNNKVQVNLFNTIIKNRFFTNTFFAILILIVLIIIYIAKLVNTDNILMNLEIFDQLIIIIIITSIPVILITWFLTFVNYLLTKEKQIQQTYESLVPQDDIMDDVDN